MLHRSATCIYAINECWKKVGGASLRGWQRMRAQPNSSNHSECAFAANKQRSQIWTVGACWFGAGVNNRAVGEHNFETNNHVFDFSVAR